jgi:hypothetical protein
MKPKIYIDYKDECIKVESNMDNKITITEAHSFIKDFISVAYDYHKNFPNCKVGNYIKERENG